MPPPIDLTGKTFGDLEVVSFVKNSPLAIKRAIYLCHCKRCGRDEELRALLLPYSPSQSRRSGVRYACTICSRGACQICGSEIISDTYKGVCSEECYIDRRRYQGRNHYKKKAKDPKFMEDQRKKNRDKLEKLKQDPEKYKEHLERDKVRGIEERKRNRERINALARQRYAEKSAQVQARKKELFDNLSEEEKILKKLQDRNLRSKNWHENKEEIIEKRRRRLEAMTDQERQAYIEDRRMKNRLSYQKRKAEKALADLMGISDKLTGKLDKDND